MPKLYAREEPTTDAIWLTYADGAQPRDTVFYRDPGLTDHYARWSWHVRNRPTRRRTVTLNCYNWQLEWRPRLT